jgi:GMP synthase (glutamine-hydrolysing)
MKPIAIFNNGPVRRAAPEFLEACGGDQDVLFAKAGGVSVGRFREIDAEAGESLPDPTHLSGVVLTGSPAMVTDRHPWVEAQAKWVRKHLGALPMLGVCFGHQVLTQALGGVVDWTPMGPEYGTIDIDLTEHAAADPLLGGMPKRLTVQAAHNQTAMRLPEGAVLLASGASGVQAVRFTNDTWGLQFHPELDVVAMRGLFEGYREHYLSKGLDVDSLTAALRETALSASIIGRFIKLCQPSALDTAAE